MPIIRRHAVLQTGSRRAPQVTPPDPRRALEVRGGEDVDVIVEVLDDAGVPVQFSSTDQLQFTVRPTPRCDDEKTIRLFAVQQPLEGPNIWKLSLSADLLRRKSIEFSRGYYDFCLIRQSGGRRDFVIEASPFRLLGAPGGQ